MCVYTCMYVYIYIHIYIHNNTLIVYTNVKQLKQEHININICFHYIVILLLLYVYIYIYICLYRCTYVYTYACIYREEISSTEVRLVGEMNSETNEIEDDCRFIIIDIIITTMIIIMCSSISSSSSSSSSSRSSSSSSSSSSSMPSRPSATGRDLRAVSAGCSVWCDGCLRQDVSAAFPCCLLSYRLLLFVGI